MNLKGCPKRVDGKFLIFNNKLQSIEGSPQIVNGDYISVKNGKKFTQQQVKKYSQVKGIIASY